MEQKAKAKGPNIVLDFGQHLRMPHNHIDPQQQGYGEKHYRLECDAAQPGHGTMMNLPFVGKVE